MIDPEPPNYDEDFRFTDPSGVKLSLEKEEDDDGVHFFARINNDFKFSVVIDPQDATELHAWLTHNLKDYLP